MNETEKRLAPVTKNHGGFKISLDNQGKRLTAVITFSAYGHVVPPFFIFASQYIMKEWFRPLPVESFKDQLGFSHWLTEKDWFPKGSIITGSKNGSMTKAVIPFVTDHSIRHASHIVPCMKMCLKLHGHRLRNGHHWLSKSKERNIEVA